MGEVNEIAKRGPVALHVDERNQRKAEYFFNFFPPVEVVSVSSIICNGNACFRI